jgi:hypothetical protein
MESNGERQEGNERRDGSFLDEARMTQLGVGIIGVGATGTRVAYELANMGVRSLVLVDPEEVGSENLGTQVFGGHDVGERKVDATAWHIRERWGTRVHVFGDRIEDVYDYNNEGLEEAGSPVVWFQCSDSMECRRDFAGEAEDRGIQFVGDSRILGHDLRITCGYRGRWDQYQDTIPEGEGVGGQCTAGRMAGYGALIAAAWLIRLYAQWTKGEEPCQDITIDLDNHTAEPQESRRGGFVGATA